MARASSRNGTRVVHFKPNVAFEPTPVDFNLSHGFTGASRPGPSPELLIVLERESGYQPLAGWLADQPQPLDD